MDEEPLSMKDSVAAHLPEWQVLHGTTAARSLESQSHHHPAAPGQRQQPRQMACSMVSVARQQQPAPRQTAAGDRLGEQLEAHLKMEAGRVLVNYVTLGMVALNW